MVTSAISLNMSRKDIQKFMEVGRKIAYQDFVADLVMSSTTKPVSGPKALPSSGLAPRSHPVPERKRSFHGATQRRRQSIMSPITFNLVITEYSVKPLPVMEICEWRKAVTANPGPLCARPTV